MRKPDDRRYKVSISDDGVIERTRNGILHHDTLPSVELPNSLAAEGFESWYYNGHPTNPIFAEETVLVIFAILAIAGTLVISCFVIFLYFAL